MSNWTKLSDCDVHGTISRATKWRSSTGLTLILADFEGPLVNAIITLATQAHDDDGLPHTLEHLIFLGSEDYPYKGLLDLFANRCFTSGTNAWTGLDHTAYTLETAGSRGMLAMLPVFLDHILYPLLTDHGFTTEIHHITKEGNDSGVLYCEILGRENDADDRIQSLLLKSIYSGTGYDAETGGRSKNLRESTTNDKVKKYYAEFYRPENTTIIITGQIKIEDIFKALKPIEDKIVKKNKENILAPFVRPWQNPIPPLEETKIIREKYSADSEDNGSIAFGWKGPKIVDHKGCYEIAGCNILLNYLTSTPIAPFQKALVEIEDPYASDISHMIYELSETMITITLGNVPIARIEQALPELQKVIHSIATASNSFELNRLRIIIDKELRNNLINSENTPHDTFPNNCILDMLYSANDDQFNWRINKQEMLYNLKKEAHDWWENLFKKYFLQHFTAVIMEPSVDLMNKRTLQEAERIEKQKLTLGDDGLSAKEKALKEAMNYNDIKPPLEMLSLVDLKDCGDLNKIKIEEWYTDGPECPHFNIKDLPFYGRINNVRTKFVRINLLMNTCNLTREERKFLPLLIKLLTESDFYRGDSKMDYNILVKDIERLTNNTSVLIGVSEPARFSIGDFQNTILVSTECEPEKYNEVVDLLWHMLNKTYFEKSRVQIVAQKMINDIAELRRDGSAMVNRLLRDMIAKKNTNINAISILRQLKFLNEATSKLEKNDSSSLDFLNILDCVRQKLVRPDNMWLHFSADLEKNKYSTEPWSVFQKEETKCQLDVSKCEILFKDYEFLIDPEEREGQVCVVGMGGENSAYLMQCSPGPKSYSHPDLPALFVAIQYFTQLEGQMWRMIRGAGLAYSFSMMPRPLDGLIDFLLYKTSNPSQAYEKAKNIMETYLQTESWDEDFFASAKSSLIYQEVKKESSPFKIIQQSMERFLQGVDTNFTMKFVKKIANVTTQDATAVTKRWLTGLFDPKLKTTVIVCNTSKINEIKEEFQTMGHEIIKIYKSVEESHLVAN